MACTNKNDQPSDQLDPKGSSATAGNKAAYCKFHADFYEEGKNVDDEEASIALVKKFAPRFDTAIADAPSDIKADVQKLLGSLRKIAEANSQSVVASEAEELSDIGKRLDAYCGI